MSESETESVKLEGCDTDGRSLRHLLSETNTHFSLVCAVVVVPVRFLFFCHFLSTLLSGCFSLTWVLSSLHTFVPPQHIAHIQPERGPALTLRLHKPYCSALILLSLRSDLSASVANILVSISH